MVSLLRSITRCATVAVLVMLGIVYCLQSASSSPSTYTSQLSELGVRNGYITITRSSENTTINLQKTHGKILIYVRGNGAINCAANVPICVIDKE